MPANRVESLVLHPGFAETWPVIRAAMDPVTVIVDGANVMGSRADGWWRDRAGAAARLYGELAALAGRGVVALPAELGAAGLAPLVPGVHPGRRGTGQGGGTRTPGGRRGPAWSPRPGSGDDTIARLAATAADGGWWSPPTGNCAAGRRTRARP